jgi:hypothetical protein
MSTMCHYNVDLTFVLVFHVYKKNLIIWFILLSKNSRDIGCMQTQIPLFKCKQCILLIGGFYVKKTT